MTLPPHEPGLKLPGKTAAIFRKRGPRLAAAGSFTALIVYLICQNVSGSVLSDVFARLDVGAAVMTVVVYLGVTATRALRFMLVGARLRFGVLFHIAAVHAALLRVMPFRSGELAYGVLLKRHGGGGMTEGLAAIILVRLLDLAATLPLAALAVALFVTDANAALVVVLLTAFGGVFGALFFGLKSVFKKMAAMLDDGQDGSRRAKLAALCLKVVDIYDLPLKQRLQLVGLTAVMWGLLLVWFHFALDALGAVSSVYQGLAASILGIGGSIVPLSLIGSFGPMEGGIALGLNAVGHSQEVALATALLVSALTFLCNWVVAVPCWVALLLEPTRGGTEADADAREPEAVLSKRWLRSALGALLFSGLAAVLLLLKYPYGFETNDQFQYLLLPYRHIYDSFLVGDWFTWEVSHYHVTFSWIIRALHGMLGASGFPYGVFALHIVVLASLGYGVLALARALHCHWIAAVGAVLLAAFVNRLGFGGAIMTHGVLLPADLALPPFLLGCAAWIGDRRVRAGLFLGLAGGLHANFAILGPLVFAVPELVRMLKTKELKGTLWFGLAYLALAWPTLGMTVWAFMTSDAAPEALEILFKVRSPHHYNPSFQASRELWYVIALAVAGLPFWLRRGFDRAHRRGLFVIAALVGAQVLAWVGTRLDSGLIIRLFFWRLSPPLMLGLSIAVGEVWHRGVKKQGLPWLVMALGGSLILAAFSAQGLVRLSPSFELSGFGVLVPVLLPLAAAALCDRFAPRRWGRWAASGLGVAALVWIALVSRPFADGTDGQRMNWASAKQAWSAFHPIETEQIEGRTRPRALYSWIRANTPPDASFLVPPGTNDFRLGARRAIFVDWKCAPMKGEEILEWKRRMLAAMGTSRFPAVGYALHRVANRRFNRRPLEAHRDLARREGLTHVLVRGKSRNSIEGMTPLITRGRFTVYRVE